MVLYPFLVLRLHGDVEKATVTKHVRPLGARCHHHNESFCGFTVDVAHISRCSVLGTAGCLHRPELVEFFGSRNALGVCSVLSGALGMKMSVVGKREPHLMTINLVPLMNKTSTLSNAHNNPAHP